VQRELDVGYVAGAHGVRGGVRIKLHDPDSVALRPGTAIELRRDGESIGRHEVRDASVVPGKPGMVRATLQGVGNRDAADALRGCTISIDRNELPDLEDDEFYLADAIGLPVRRQAQPADLGTIVGLSTNGVQDLFEVQWVDETDRKHDWLLPVLPEFIVEIDEAQVFVDVPPGFLPAALEVDS